MEQQSSSERPVRLSNEALAYIFGKAVESFKEFEDREQRPEFARELFTHTFNFGVEQLDLSVNDAARIMTTSRPGIERWRDGKSAPHPVGRASVFNAFLKETNRRIEHDTATED